MTPEERLKLIERTAKETNKSATPIDFEELVAKGAISKEGAWYRVHELDKLPEHAKAQISEISQDQKGTKAKFSK